MIPRTLADFTGSYKGSGEEHNYQCCPVCGADGWKVYVNTQTGKWFCFAAQHGKGGVVESDNWSEQARVELLAMLDGTSSTAQNWVETDLPKWVPLTETAQSYLCKRGVSSWASQRLSMVEMADQPRIIVPFFGAQGKLIYWTARSYMPTTTPKYLSAPGVHPPFMLPRWERVDSAVLVEGVFDAIAVWQATGLPVLALGGKTISAVVEREVRQLVREHVTIMLDGDAVAQAIDLSQKLMDLYSTKLVVPAMGADPGSMSAEELKVRLVTGGGEG